MPYYTKFEILSIGNHAKFLTILRYKELLSIKECDEYLKSPVKFLPYSNQIKDCRMEWGYEGDGEDVEDVEECLIEADCSFNKKTVYIRSDYEKEREWIQTEKEQELLDAVIQIRNAIKDGYTNEYIVEIIRQILE